MKVEGLGPCTTDNIEGERTQHSIEMNLGLRVSDFSSRDREGHRCINIKAVRSTLVDILTRLTLPDIFRQSIIPVDVTKGEVSSEAEMKIEGGVFLEKVEDALALRAQLKIVLSIKTSEPVNATTALALNTKGLANGIANGLIHRLLQYFTPRGPRNLALQMEVKQDTTGTTIEREEAIETEPGPKRPPN